MTSTLSPFGSVYFRNDSGQGRCIWLSVKSMSYGCGQKPCATAIDESATPRPGRAAT